MLAVVLIIYLFTFQLLHLHNSAKCRLPSYSPSFNSPYYIVDTVTSGVGSIFSVTVDPRTGEQYLSGQNSYVIYKVSTYGSKSVFAGSGAYGRSDGTGTAASFSQYVLQISYCSYDGYFYIADTNNNIIRQLNTMSEVKTIAGGTVSGTGLDNGIGTNAKFNLPNGVICNRNNGDLIVADSNNFVLRLISWSSTRTVTLFAGGGGIGTGASGFADGMGTYALFSSTMWHICQNSVNTHFYLADRDNHLIRQVTVLGVVSTFAGHQGVSNSGDGIGTLAYFNTPIGVSCDDVSGNIIVGDYNNHRIRSIDVSTGLITTIAGSTLGSAVNGIGTYTQVITYHIYFHTF